MFDNVATEPEPAHGHHLPDDDLDGELERLLAAADALPEWMPDFQPAEWAGVPPDEPLPGDEPERWANSDAPASAYGSYVPSGWLAVDLDAATADLARLSDATLVEAMIGFDRIASWAAARQARLMAELARRRPTDQAPYSARWAGVGSEYAPDEVGVALHLARGTACARVGLACRLLAALPETHELWEAGRIDTGKARAIDDATWMLTPELARAVQDRVLPKAPEQTLAQLKAALARAVLAADPDGAERRHREARRDRRVVISPEVDGMASLWALLTATQAAGAFAWLTRLARGLGTDDPRSMDTRRADILAALLSGQLVLDPGTRSSRDATPTDSSETDTDTDSTSASSAVHGTETTGSSAVHGTETIGSVDAADTADTATGRPIHAVAPGKSLMQIVIPHSTLIGADDHPAELAGYGPIPASLARDTAADSIWRRLITDPLSGTLLDHGRTTYCPPAGLADHVKARDLHCRFPGCRRRAADAELDHVVAWSDGGTTSEPNLASCCTHHHRVKTYAGWRVEARPDGRLTWITPTGHRHTTEPHDYRPEPVSTVASEPALSPPAPGGADPHPPPF